MSELSLEEKRELARRLLRQKQAESVKPETSPSYTDFMSGTDRTLSEVRSFSSWISQAKAQKPFSLERTRLTTAEASARYTGAPDRELINLSTYNYLGLSAHPRVVEAARAAIERYGIGSGASPIASGKLEIHEQLEQELLCYFDRPNSGVTLYSAGYNVNTGSISALMRPGTHLVLDSLVHASIEEGAKLSGATVHTFRHNDVEDLSRVLKSLLAEKSRVMVCTEGVFSADGDFGKVAEIADTAKRYGALLLVDEAHSTLLCGPKGRGVAAAQGVLEKVDLLVITFSKGFGGIGGALVADRAIADYVNWYSRSRLFSCAISPGVTAGVLEALRLASGPEGDERRNKLQNNADFLRNALNGKVATGESTSWVVPVIFGAESMSVELLEYLRASGLEATAMEFPGVPRGEARLRLFVTSEHTETQLERAAEVVLAAARRFGFHL